MHHRNGDLHHTNGDVHQENDHVHQRDHIQRSGDVRNSLAARLPEASHQRVVTHSTQETRCEPYRATCSSRSAACSRS
jgi:hypothetical protein